MFSENANKNNLKILSDLFCLWAGWSATLCSRLPRLHGLTLKEQILGGVSLKLNSRKCTVNMWQRLDAVARRGFCKSRHPDEDSQWDMKLRVQTKDGGLPASSLQPKRPRSFSKIHPLGFMGGWSVTILRCCPPTGEYRPCLHIYKEDVCC